MSNAIKVKIVCGFDPFPEEFFEMELPIRPMIGDKIKVAQFVGVDSELADKRGWRGFNCVVTDVIIETHISREQQSSYVEVYVNRRY